MNWARKKTYKCISDNRTMWVSEEWLSLSLSLFSWVIAEFCIVLFQGKHLDETLGEIRVTWSKNCNSFNFSSHRLSTSSPHLQVKLMPRYLLILTTKSPLYDSLRPSFHNSWLFCPLRVCYLKVEIGQCANLYKCKKICNVHYWKMEPVETSFVFEKVPFNSVHSS